MCAGKRGWSCQSDPTPAVEGLGPVGHHSVLAHRSCRLPAHTGSCAAQKMPARGLAGPSRRGPPGHRQKPSAAAARRLRPAPAARGEAFRGASTPPPRGSELEASVVTMRRAAWHGRSPRSPDRTVTVLAVDGPCRHPRIARRGDGTGGPRHRAMVRNGYLRRPPRLGTGSRRGARPSGRRLS